MQSVQQSSLCEGSIVSPFEYKQELKIKLIEASFKELGEKLFKVVKKVRNE